MARLASSPNALQPRPVVVLPSYREQEPFPAQLHCLPGVEDTSSSSFGPQPAQPGALLNLDRRCPPPTDPMGSVPAVRQHLLQPVPRHGIFTSVLTLPKMCLRRAERRGRDLVFGYGKRPCGNSDRRLRPLGGKRFLRMEVFTPSPSLLRFRLGRLSLTLMKPRVAVCEQEAEPSSPSPWTT